MSTPVLSPQTEQSQPQESALKREDRCTLEALAELMKKKELTDEEKMKKEVLWRDVMVKTILDEGGMPCSHADHDRRDLIERVHRELRDEYGSETVSKKLLIERLTAAYSMSLSYERLFRNVKYTFNEKGDFEYMGFIAPMMKEIRMGIRTANEEMIRFVQALRDLTRPPLTVKATNAFFAQNQQVNQGSAPPSDLENDSSAISQHAPYSRRKSTAARS